MCNGANLAYRKDIFLELGGFINNNHVASGDDIFLLEKYLNYDKTKVCYLKCTHAIIKTKPQPTWKDLITQRIRWASKTTHYNNHFGKLVGLIVLITNASIIISIFLTITEYLSIKYLFIGILIKSLCDFILIVKTHSFLVTKNTLLYFLPSSIIYPFFTTFIAFKSTFSDYNWKGRKHRV